MTHEIGFHSINYSPIELQASQTKIPSLGMQLLHDIEDAVSVPETMVQIDESNAKDFLMGVNDQSSCFSIGLKLLVSHGSMCMEAGEIDIDVNHRTVTVLAI